jgi:diguanylate cyclase (GGDEF)-like protein/PAS domain S-box-containing protein
MFCSKKSMILSVCLYLLLGCAWILGTDYLLERFFPDSGYAVVWQSVKGMIFVVGTAIYFYLALRSMAAKVAVECILALSRDSHDSNMRALRSDRLRLWVPVGIFLITILVLVIAGITSYRQVSATMRKNAWADLVNLAGLKAREVDAWRQERFGDVATITGDASFMASLQDWLQQPGTGGAVPERIARRMDAVRRGYGYHAIVMCDASGTLRFTASEHSAVLPEPAIMAKVLREVRPLFSAFHVPQPRGPHVIDFVVPLINGSMTGKKVFGVVVFRMAGENKLFPGLHWWPGGMRSAETLLVQNVNNGSPALVTFQHNAERKLILGTTGDDGSLQAFLQRVNRSGLSEIVDYRGVPVLAATEAVPDSDWLLITKVDREEIYRPLLRLSLASGAAVLFLIGVSAIGIGLWWRQQTASYALEWLQGQLQRQALLKHLEYLTKFANDIILLMDAEGCIIEANDRAVATYGYPRDTLTSLNIRKLRAPDTLSDFDDYWKKAYDEGVMFETVHCRADGTVFPVEVSSRRVEVEGEMWCQSIIRDISERKQSEYKIKSLTRLYNVLSQTNQAIVRHQDRQALFDEICRIAVELGALHMAVITSVDQTGGKISPVAGFSADQAFLDSINSFALSGEGGHGPTLQVIQSHCSFICNDIACDPVMRDCLKLAERFGFRSVALFPLFRGEYLFGTLNLYAAEKEFFESDLVAVLEEMATDISFALNNFDKELARKKAEERLRKTSATLTAVFQATPLPVMINDLKGRTLFWNQSAEQVFGWTEKEISGRVLPLVPHELKQEFFQKIEQAKNGELLRGVEVTQQRRDGTLLDMLLFTAPLYDGQGKVENIVALFMDISEQKQAREHIVCLAHYDQLTGLGNRILLKERFVQESSRAQRDDRRLAFCLIDLDKFKMVNDALGHALGDKLLIQVARRLENSLRRADVICRPGGDEFVVMLTDLETSQDAGKIVQKIQENLEKPFSLDGHTVRMSASMGISLFPEDGSDLDTLFRNADTAMYAAKERGRNNFMFFQSEMDHRIRNRLNLENSLREALEEQDFFLHYQPQVDIASGRIIGAEALLRFRHPVQGLISPDRLIPIAEDSGLIVPMGEWILEEACRQLNLWQAKGLVDLTMAVNLSAVQIFQENFASRAKEILDAHNINPKHLYFELTESIFMEEDDRVRQTLFALKKLGVGISLDDFGTGYSSLSYLKRYAVDEIKIDRTFVQDVCSDPGDAAIVQATIQMAHSLGLTTVAEGVETFEQLAFLSSQQCDRYQGYLCSQPMAPDEFLALVQAS